MALWGSGHILCQWWQHGSSDICARKFTKDFEAGNVEVHVQPYRSNWLWLSVLKETWKAMNTDVKKKWGTGRTLDPEERLNASNVHTCSYIGREGKGLTNLNSRNSWETTKCMGPCQKLIWHFDWTWALTLPPILRGFSGRNTYMAIFCGLFVSHLISTYLT